MLTLTTSTSAAGTARYFETLTQGDAGDYYLDDTIKAKWQGKTADLMGLGVGTTLTKTQFMELLAGRNPVNGQPLTQRTRKNRRAGMDMTFSCPKSVSLAWGITKDDCVLQAFREAVTETIVEDVEPSMHRRVRSGPFSGTKKRVQTANMLWAGFEHKTSRPCDDQVDPQLHMHAFVFNVTEQSGRYYAAEMGEIVRQKARLEAGFKARLARKLEQHGYTVRRTCDARTGKFSFEIDGIERATIDKFSNRTKEIEKHAQERGITDPARKAALGKTTRQQKGTEQTLDSLHTHWDSRLTPTERFAFQQLRGGNGKEESTAITAEEAVQFSLEHHLENTSTVEEHQLIATALRYAVTQEPAAIQAAMNRPDVIRRQIDVDGAEHCHVTTLQVLEQERALIAFARDSRGTKKSLRAQGEHTLTREYLNDQQRAAVAHICESRDQVIMVTGGAGVGKSACMAEAADAIRGSGKQVFACAPSTGATEVLKENGFAEAQTVEHVIRNTQRHSELKEQVLLVDEAGLLDSRSMSSLFQIAKTQNARVILVGDSRQHASPKRGESLRLLEHEAGIEPARIHKIQRQHGEYRRAVELISRGHEIVDQRTQLTGLLAGFDRLDRLGKIVELGDEDRHAQLAACYLDAEQRGRSTIVVAPTHREGRAVTEVIRDRLRKAGSLERDECVVLQLRSLHLTNAEKAEFSSYERLGLIVQFHQNAKGGFVRGERYRVQTDVNNHPQLVPVGNPAAKPKPLPSSYPDRFEVYREEPIGLSVGDKVRFTLGGRAQDRKTRIANGRIDELTRFRPSGDIELASGLVISKDYGHIDHGFVVTSHASQGQTRDVAIAAMGSESLPAVNARQAYVTISRGRQEAILFVDDKEAVRRAIQSAGKQLSATELMAAAAGVAPDCRLRAAQHTTISSHRTLVRDNVRRWWQRIRTVARDWSSLRPSMAPTPPVPGMKLS